MQAILEEIEQRHGLRLGDGLQILGRDGLLRRPVDPGMALLILADGSARATSGTFDPVVLPGRDAHGTDVLSLLRRLYPADHPVLGVAGAPDTTLADLDGSRIGKHALVLPAVQPEEALASPHGLPWLVARLRAPDGCPWDREQDHRTLRKFLLEETYEVYDALERGSTPQLAEELGDLLLQIVLHAQYAAEAGVFDIADVYRSIMAKIIRRHPHVFGDVQAETAQQVTANWEAIKATERAAGMQDGAAHEETRQEMPGAFAGLSRALPALAYAHEMQERAAGLGYDWQDLEGVLDKMEEEAVELLGAADPPARYEEFGDLLFVVVNLGRKLGVDPEAALRAASRKFASRFAKVERMAEADGVELRTLRLDQLDELWQRAKAAERRSAPAGSLT